MAADHAVQESLAWASFASARLASEYCQAWLHLQCRLLPDTRAGLLLLEDEDRSFTPAAAWPTDSPEVMHLVPLAERALRERQAVVARADADAHAHVAYPVQVRGHLWGVVCLDLGATADAALQSALRQLHWGAGWLETLFLRRVAEQDTQHLATAKLALDMVAVAGDARGMAGAATALASELAVRLVCRRVAIGSVRHGHVRLVALSHVAGVSQKHRLADGIANAMEEAADQGATVAWPPLTATARRIAIAHRSHAETERLTGLLSVVLLHGGKPAGVVLFERDDAIPFDARTLALAEGMAELLGPVLALQLDLDQPLTGRMVRSLGTAWRALLGRRHPTVKLTALVAVAAVAWLFLGTDEYRIAGKATLEGEELRAAAAPFDGYVAAAPRRAGDIVEAGETLAVLDTREVELEALRYEAQRDQALLKAQDAQGKHDQAEAAIALANAAEADAQLSGARDKLKRARLTAPFRGVIVSGDLSQQLAAPVERGKVLFEVAPLDRYRVVVQADEREVASVQPGQTGRLLLNGLSGIRLDFHVTRVVPVAVANDGRNFFRVEGALEGALEGGAAALRPGMEGVGKIVAGRASLMWVYGHAAWEWARLTLWRLMP